MRPRDTALALLVVVLWGVSFVVIKLIGLAGGALTFGERFTATQLAGSALVATGLAIPMLAARRVVRSVTDPASRP